MVLELYDFTLILIGIALLGTTLLPRFISDWPVSIPIFYLAFGYLAFSLPLGLPAVDPIEQSPFAERLAELGVIIALMTAGLKIDRPPSISGWESVWRLLGITMPLTIAGAAVLGWWVVGLAVPTAVLLGAVIAPTDPVLATEVQVEGPGKSAEAEDVDQEGGGDEIRFALTGEAGLNDGFAFPFTNLAVAMAFVGAAPGNWIGEWVLVDVLFRIAVALAVGFGLGWMMGRIIFLGSVGSALAKSMLGLEALAGTFIVYGVTEFFGGYGFIAVFIAATVVRHYEREHEYYEPLHDLAEKAEQILMTSIIVLFGGAIANGLLAPVTRTAILTALALVFVVRPLAGFVALIGFERDWKERAAVSFFGLRGIGTFYYLSFALNEAPFTDAELVWTVAGLTVLVSIVVHGLTATPIVENRLAGGG